MAIINGDPEVTAKCIQEAALARFASQGYNNATTLNEIMTGGALNNPPFMLIYQANWSFSNAELSFSHEAIVPGVVLEGALYNRPVPKP